MSYISGQTHSFDIALAAKYGIEEAILIHHFQHWVRVNRKLGRNIKDGKCWSYQTHKEIQAHFPYLKYQTIKYSIERLVERGVLIKKNYNKAKIDKTCWYAFVDEKAFHVDDESISNMYYERENSPSKEKIPTPIPDTKTKDTYVSKETKEREESKETVRPSSFAKKQKKGEGEKPEGFEELWEDVKKAQMGMSEQQIEKHGIKEKDVIVWLKNHSLGEVRETIDYSFTQKVTKSRAAYVQALLKKKFSTKQQYIAENKALCEAVIKEGAPHLNMLQSCVEDYYYKDSYSYSMKPELFKELIVKSTNYALRNQDGMVFTKEDFEKMLREID